MARITVLIVLFAIMTCVFAAEKKDDLQTASSFYGGYGAYPYYGGYYGGGLYGGYGGYGGYGAYGYPGYYGYRGYPHYGLGYGGFYG